MKKGLYVVIALLLAAAFLSSCAKGVGATGISLEEFNKLKLDMSYEKACSIIGGEGKLISKTESDEPEFIKFTSVYRFEGENSGYAELEFTLYSYKDIYKIDFKDYLTGKTQFDLK